MDVQSPETPSWFSLRLDVYPLPQVLQTDRWSYHPPIASLVGRVVAQQQGPFAPRTLLRFFTPMGPSESLSSSTDFPVFPVIRFPAPLLSEAGRGGPLQVLGASLPSCCCFNPARVNRRFSQPATSHAAFAQRTRARPPGRRISRPNLHSLSLRPDDSLTILKDGFVSRFQRFDFSPPCYSSYEVSDCYLGGTHLPLNTSVFQLDTHSFFFVSTEMTGRFWAKNFFVCSFTYSNCALRSGCCRPSIVLALACKL